MSRYMYEDMLECGRQYEYRIDPSLPAFMNSYSVPRGQSTRNSLYGQPIVDLSKATQNNIDRLKTKLVMIDPCYELSIENWHSNSKQVSDVTEPYVYPSYATPTWEEPKSVFMDRNALDKNKTRYIKDDYSESANGTASKFCDLCSTLDEHQRHIARRSISMKAPAKRKPRISYIAPPPTLKAKQGEEVAENADVLYKVLVRTGTKPDAGTTANVFIHLKGRLGSLKKRQLKKNMSVGYAFGRGTKETFYIKGPKLGDLTNLTLEHDGMEKKHSWFVDDVEVTDMASNKTWIFPLRNWLSLYLGDGVLKRHIKAYVKEVTQQDYIITIWTGNMSLGGTDSRVYITLYGKEGVGPRTRLLHDQDDQDDKHSKRPGTPFKRGQQDTFTIKSDYHGPLTRIRIEHDNSGKKSPDWFVEKVEIREADSDKVLVFPCGMWLSAEEGDGKIARDLYPIKDPKQIAKIIAKKKKGTPGDKSVRYEVMVETGSVRHAGTDANVFLLITGKLGKTNEILLDNEKNNFEQGMTDVFNVYAEDVGDIKRIRMRHDNTGVGAGWFLETVRIRRYFTDKEVAEMMAELEAHMEDEAMKRASEVANVPVSGAKVHKKAKQSSRSSSVRSLTSIMEENENSDEDGRKPKDKRRKSKNDRQNSKDDRRKSKLDEIDSDEDERLRKLYQKSIGKEDSNNERRGSYSEKRRKSKDSSKESYKKEESKNEEGVFKNLGRKMSKFFGIGDDKEKEKEKEQKEKKEKKISGMKSDSDSDSDSDDGIKRKKIKGKMKKLYKYNGVETWVTDSEYDSEDDRKKKKKKKKKYELESDDDRKNRKGKSRHDSDESDKKKRRKNGRGPDGRKKKSLSSSSESLSSSSDSESGSDNFRKKGKKKSNKKYDESDSEDERKRITQKKYCSDSDSDDKKQRKKRDSDDSDSDEYETKDEKLYKEWQHNRVPYCDEYYFVCKRWLATDEDDREIQRDLKPKSVTTFYKTAQKKSKKKKKHR